MDLFARRLTRGQLVALDCLAAWVFALGFMASASGGPGWARLSIPLALGIPLALRRLWPVPVFALVLAVAVVGTVLGVVEAAYLSPAYALYLVALVERRGGRVPTVAAALATVLAAMLLVLAGSPTGWTRSVGYLITGVAALGAAWTVGRAVRERRGYAAREAERLAERAVTEERLRIARELHDVVAHSVGVIAVKAGVANHVLHTRPEEAYEALRVIETASRGALTEMRQLLGVLRSGDGPGLRPAPGLDGLTALAEQARLAGVDVDLVLDLGGGAVPEGVGLSVYRIVQEALTNVVKHAAPARCRVSVRADGREVRIEATDDGPGHRTLPAAGSGHGLIGMRERVMMYGGAFEAGPLPGRGFRVFARLPYQEIS
ncbi:sensor histidine kinase [Nonomuraea sp. NPDC050536]|uniref:sensor histidine kinase n=1 Tax=Nonomuraea sp. NPDC050536 TaxID=3364366 RepID=UPI0037C8010D